jgi:uncharacterized protein YmfQ (DUF2313 family)
VGLSAAAFARMLLQLLPPGRWNRDPDAVMASVALASADELERLDARSHDLIDESIPSSTDELLPEWEQLFELEPEGLEDERRARVVARIVARGRVRPVDFQVALAPLLGQAAEDVVVMERTRAFAISIGDDQEIYRFFIYRDPTEPGTADIEAAQTLLDDMAQSHTKGHVIESIDFRTEDPFSLTDRDLLGA